MSKTSLQSAYPWTAAPFIANAPMAGFAGAALAAAVTRAGGLGFVGTVSDMAALAAQLDEASATLADFNSSSGGTGTGSGTGGSSTSTSTSSSSSSRTLPIGVGFLPFVAKLEQAAPVIAKYRPAAVWLFAAREIGDYATWTERVRAVSGSTQIWIQVGSVADAREVARRCRPDVLTVQGADAGGHGLEKGAGIVSLVPETADALAADGWAHIPLVAAGGIVDGRGVAAALALGAAGVVMVTRFLAALETTVPHPGYRAQVLQTRDGGQRTVRAKVFDELRGPNIWPTHYNGRGVVSESYGDYVGGVEIGEIRRLHGEAVREDGAGYAPHNKRAVVWAGTGVGLVTEAQAAGEIVVEVREEARRAIEWAKSYL